MRRNKWIAKKILSLCVALAMLITLFGGPYMVAMAQDIEIDVVEVDITIPLVGDSNTQVSYSVPEGANYTVTPGNTNWMDGSGVNEAGDFYSGDTYIIYFDVEPASGYVLGENTIVTVNKNVAGVLMLGGATCPAAAFEYSTEPVVLGTIDKIDFGNLPSGDIGQTAADYSFSGTNYTVTGEWKVFDRSQEYWNSLEDTHVFTSGNVYRLDVEAYPNAGYIFSDNLTATVDGKVEDSLSYSSMWAYTNKTVSHAVEISQITYDLADALDVKVGDKYDGSMVAITVPAGSNYTAYGYWYDENGNMPSVFEKGKDYSLRYLVVANDGYSFAEYLYANGKPVHSDGATFELIEIKSFTTTLNQAVITGVTEPKVGQDIPKGSSGDVIELSVPDGASYTAHGIWRYSDGGVATGKFEDGKAYRLDVNIVADDGSRFSLDALLTINGTTYRPYGTESQDYGRILSYALDYSFCEKIEKIEITGFKEPAIGETAQTDTVKVPKDANYQIETIAWYDWDTRDEITTFEEGYAYVFETCIIPEEGYEFSQDAVVLLDGEDITDICVINDNSLYVNFDYWFKKVVPEVRLDNIQNPAVGDMPFSDVKIPESSKYVIDEALWGVWNDELGYYEPFTGPFKAGEAYNLYVRIFVDDEEYMFDSDDTRVYVNGALCEDAYIYADTIEYNLYFSPGMKVIDSIELMVQSPVIGQSATIAPILTIPVGVNYKVESEAYRRPMWIEGNVDSWKYYDGLFKEDDNYGVSFYVIAGAGYVFAEELQIMVNGTIINKKNVFSDEKVSSGYYFFEKECAHEYSDWKDVGDGTHARECTICGVKDSAKHAYQDNKCAECGNMMQVDAPSDDKTDESAPGDDKTDESAPGDDKADESAPNGDVAGDNNSNNDSSPATGDDSPIVPIALLMMVCGAIVIRLKKETV